MESQETFILLWVRKFFVSRETNFLFLTSITETGLVASGSADKLRVPILNPDTGWPLFLGKTTEWPKITYMLP